MLSSVEYACYLALEYSTRSIQCTLFTKLFSIAVHIIFLYTYVLKPTSFLFVVGIFAKTKSSSKLTAALFYQDD